MEERRVERILTDAEDYLQQLPSLVLLDRLPVAMIGVELRGDIAYANAACAELLGFLDAAMIKRLSLPKLLSGHEVLSLADCVATLRTATSIVRWNHYQGYEVHTMLSPPLLLRATDELVLVGMSDVTAWRWETDHPKT